MQENFKKSDLTEQERQYVNNLSKRLGLSKHSVKLRDGLRGLNLKLMLPLGFGVK